MARHRPLSIGQSSGSAAAIAAAMEADGVDLTKPAAISEWLIAFNERSDEERLRILGEDLLGARPSELPSIELPDEDEARRSAAHAPLASQIRRLVEFFSDARKLTQTGNVTLADARRLVELLGTGDRFDATIGDRTFKTKSAADLPRLDLVIRVATKARFVRIAKGTMVATKAGRSIGTDPLVDLGRIVKAIDDVGMVSARVGRNRPAFAWQSLAPFFDDQFVPLATLLLTVPGSSVEFDQIVDLTFDQFEAEIDVDNPYWNEAFRRRFVESEMATAIGVLETAGLVVWHGEPEVADHGARGRRHGLVEATPAGRLVLHRHLAAEHGIELPTGEPASLTHLDFETLVATCDNEAPGDFGRLRRELEAWMIHHGEHTLGELIAAARRTDDLGLRTFALATLSGPFAADAEPHVRGLLDVPAARGSALFWLVDNEFEPADVLLDPDPAVFMDVLTLALTSRGPDAMIELVIHVGDRAAQLTALARLEHQPHPAGVLVLSAIARHHPDEHISTAAGRALQRYEQ